MSSPIVIDLNDTPGTKPTFGEKYKTVMNIVIVLLIIYCVYIYYKKYYDTEESCFEGDNDDENGGDIEKMVSELIKQQNRNLSGKS